MDKLEFQVGKKYKRIQGSATPRGILIIRDDGAFECHGVVHDCCMSMDVLYDGERMDDGEGWMAAYHSELKSGIVIEVTE